MCLLILHLQLLFAHIQPVFYVRNMTQLFDVFRPGFQLVQVHFEWNIPMPFQQSAERNCLRWGPSISPPFFAAEASDKQWIMWLNDCSTQSVIISLFRYKPAEKRTYINDQVLVKISILNGKGEEVLQQLKPLNPKSLVVLFCFTNEDIIRSQCQQTDGSYTFYCQILFHVKKERFVSSGNPPGIAINRLNGLSTHFQELLDTMHLSDVNFYVRGREFPAHKIVLIARSKVFAGMFQHPTKENLTNQVTIEDLEPEVFEELLRFIYTGRVTLAKMETTAAGLVMAADKYLLDELKQECGNYLLCQMSPANCLEILLNKDLLFPVERLKNKAANFFCHHQQLVEATDKWQQLKQENPKALHDIQEFVLQVK